MPEDKNCYLKKKLGEQALEQAFRAGVYLKRSRNEYEQLGRDMINGHMSGNRDYPMNMDEAHRKMDFCKPCLSQKRESDGTQRLQTEEEPGNAIEGEQHFGNTKGYFF